MGIVKRKERAEFDLDNDYYVNRVYLKETEAEHTHNFIELVYTESGKGTHVIDGKEYIVRGGDLLIVNYRCRHTVIPAENLSYVDIMLKPEYVNATLKGTEDIFLLLTLRDFSDLSNNVIKDNIFLHFNGEERKKIEFLLGWTGEEQRTPSAAGNLVMYSALSMLLCLVFRKMTKNAAPRLSLDERLLTYMEENSSCKLPISEIAARCGYTKEHFSRVFKSYTGLLPSDFIFKCRIKRACEMLRKTDKPIELIIHECGFSNRSAFFKKFFDSTGTTPLKFRKNQN